MELEEGEEQSLKWYTLNEKWPQEGEGVLAVFRGKRGDTMELTFFTYNPWPTESGFFLDGFATEELHDAVIAWSPIAPPQGYSQREFETQRFGITR